MEDKPIEEVFVCRPCEEKSKLIEGEIGSNYGLRDKARNLASGIGDMVREDYVSNEEYMRRKEICRGCPHRINFITGIYNADRVTKADKCTVCDCFLIARVGKLRGKCWLSNQDCPLGKWNT